jgi:hypothetical protein
VINIISKKIVRGMKIPLYYNKRFIGIETFIYSSLLKNTLYINEPINQKVMEKVGRYNGNNQYYETDIPKIVIIGGANYNDVAISHIEKNTGMKCVKNGHNLEMQPTTAMELMKLFVTYDFKTQYHDNNTFKNTLFLKSSTIEGFKVEHICYNCVVENRINTNGLEPHHKLSV